MRGWAGERAMNVATPERTRLANALKEAGSALGVAAVEALIAGVLAAPPEIGASWHALVAEPTPPALAAALDALKAALAASHHDGVQPEDFTRLPRDRRLRLLRDRLTADGLAGFVVPRADEHQGEYVPLRGQRLAWLTGFTGSAGMAVVLKDSAAIFVDGRYTLQAAAQVDTQAFEIHHLIDEPPASQLAGGSSIRRWISKACVSPCAAACRVYRPSTRIAALPSSTTAIPAEPVKPVSQARRWPRSGTYSP